MIEIMNISDIDDVLIVIGKVLLVIIFIAVLLSIFEDDRDRF
jgi:hypothetical protein